MRNVSVIGLAATTISVGLMFSGELSSAGSSVTEGPVGEAALEPGQPSVRVAATGSAEAAAEKVYRPGDVHLGSSRVYVFVGKTGFGHEHAIEGRLSSGTLALVGGEPAGELVFDMRSFSADTPAARKYIGLEGSTDAGTRRQVNANMLGADVLNVRKYPTAKLTVTSVTPLKQASRDGHPRYRIDGRFTLHGRTRRISLIASAATKGDWTHVRGKFSILQTDYGIEPYSKAFGAVGVTDQLTIWGDLWTATTRQVLKRAQ